ncbi:MAG: sugar phosphate isomerase/epimerase [Kiritimatiellae bacterium]|jgi:sugar phosphate isomerase/epimerase|nr:sugar phosphate isomerase/epimerase [Kiritimatiellia bacterium]
MKLAFTTLGCLDWDLDTIIAATLEYGYQGIDFRGYLNELNIYKLPEFSTDVEATKAKIKSAGLEVSCFSASIRLIAPDEKTRLEFVEEILEYTKLAKIFGTKYIRIFGGGWLGRNREEAISEALKNMNLLLEATKDSDVIFAIETHDEWVDTSTIKDFLEKMDNERVKAVWDVNHPYRGGESPEKTYENIGKWVVYTHWKDSRYNQDTPRKYDLCLPGEGDLPLKRFYELLELSGYEGWQTLEWEKKWNPEIDEPEIAFPAFVKLMKEISS